MESPGPLVKGQKRKAGQLNKAIIGSSPILYTQPAATAGKHTSLHICSFLEPLFLIWLSAEPSTVK